MKTKGDTTLYRTAEQVLKRNARPEKSPVGVVAGERYRESIWGRDGLICCLAMSGSDDEELVNLAERTIDTLAGNQKHTGQIPNKIAVDLSRTSFGKGGCVDASLWYPVAVWNHYKSTNKSEFLERNRYRIEEAVKWANCLDQNNDYLIEANPRSEWFDLYGRMGRVLYTQVLNYAALECLYRTLDEMNQPGVINWALDSEELPQRIEKVKRGIQEFFWPTEEYTGCIEKEHAHSWIHQDFRAALKKKEELKRTGAEYFLSSVGFDSADARFDTIANCLAILFGVAKKEQAESIIDYMIKKRIGKPYPAKVLSPPVTPRDPEFRLVFPDPEFRHSDEPELHKTRASPGNYHNGGIWPWVGGFYVLALEKTGKNAGGPFDDLSKVNSLFDYGFIEWINAEGNMEGAYGTSNQSWSAASYMLAHQKIADKKHILFDDFHAPDK